MYSRREKSLMRKNFWTMFGQYMRPVLNANDEELNWLNYKTGARHIYFRLDATEEYASVAIELRHPETSRQEFYFEKFKRLERLFHQTMGEGWNWQLHMTDEDGKHVSRIRSHLNNVNVCNNNDWPAMISFLKPRVIALDQFWNLVKEEFET
jgi:hypothetical protein